MYKFKDSSDCSVDSGPPGLEGTGRESSLEKVSVTRAHPSAQGGVTGLRIYFESRAHRIRGWIG